jgi:hypothetical protein
MTSLWDECRKLTDDELTMRLKGATARERKALAWLLVHLSEFDVRHLAAESANPSLFMYCTCELGYSEGAAYKRIHAARAVRRFPIALEMLADGRIHLAAIVALAPHLTERNHVELLEEARGKTKRDVEALVARLGPREPRPDNLRHFSLSWNRAVMGRVSLLGKKKRRGFSNASGLSPLTARQTFTKRAFRPRRLPMPPTLRRRPRSPVRLSVSVHGKARASASMPGKTS